MNDFVFVTTCNRPRLRDPTRALEVIGRYWFDWDLAVGLASDTAAHHLTIEGEGWPGAWQIPEHTPAELSEPDLAADGMPAFEAFLKDIACCLAERLIVQAIGSKSGRFPLLAAEWRIEPSSKRLRRRHFSGFHASATRTLQVSAP